MNRCVTVCLCGVSSDSRADCAATRLFLRPMSSSTSSSVCKFTVHPGGIAEWWRSRFVDLKLKPPKTGVMLYICLHSPCQLVSHIAERKNDLQYDGPLQGTDLPIGQVDLLDHIAIVQSMIALSSAKRKAFTRCGRVAAGLRIRRCHGHQA